MKSENDLKKLRHSAAHLLAHAIKELFPHAKTTIGPATPTGFFYDFLPQQNFKDEDLPIIEKKMHEIVQRDLPITHKQISKDKARTLYKNNPFKLELIDQIPGETVGIAEQGDFFDLCRGGHVASTGQIKYFKLLNTSGSYWRADKSNQALQRITGTAFSTQEDLDRFIQRRQDAIKYDHRRLGKELDLFSFHEEGIGFPFFHPNGKTIITILTNYLRKLLEKANYKEISTPIMLSDELWKRSGHYDHYKDHMYFCVKEEKVYAVKPMNCPGAILIYQERPHSYRELPLRLAEFGLVHRYELSGVLHGLFRTRSFTIDDGHIFCTEEQIEPEVANTIEMTYEVFKRFSFHNITIGVSTKPDNAMGSDILWEKATSALKQALDNTGHTYEVYEGEGAFYGPKIEFRIEDSMGRTWQCGTIQIDFFLPKNFDLSYIQTTGTKARPVLIHRAIYGSFERFFAILLEHYKGNFPFWLAPVQVKVLTITDKQKEYAQTIAQQLSSAGIRTLLDESSDPISGQIKTAQLQRIPWMIIIGNKEVTTDTVAIRYRDGKQEFGLSLASVLEKAKKSDQ
ncbi:MAG TPA: threonine--tRNA ligase [Candidatus Dependentiae bacterium]|nr:threonine--tRNA ligase [Candidatus Dependentiae bacterium]